MALQIQTYLSRFDGSFGAELSTASQFLLVGVRSSQNGNAVRKRLKNLCPAAQIHISTTCQGIMTEKAVGLHEDDIAMMTFEDVGSAFGTAGARLEDPHAIKQSTNLLLQRAELRAERAGELPAMVWMSAPPGSEEKVIKAIQEYYIGPVLISGGSAADDHINGSWWVGDQEETYPQGLVISLLYTQAKLTTRFSAGYQIAGCRGTITAGGSREIIAIDNRKAAEVYNEWCKGSLSPYFPDGNILKVSTYQPLAIQCGQLAMTPYHRIVHPSQIHPSGSISTFADIAIGDNIVLLQGDEDSLVSRAQRVVQCALLEADVSTEDIICAQMIFCAGCFLAIKDRIQEVWEGIASELPNVPMLCQFTFGEQGVFPDGKIAHGNLMISIVIWSQTKDLDSWFD